MPTGAELFVDSLKRLGIDRVFTLVGDHLNEVLSVAAREGIDIVHMRHESGVTHAADAWARIHRKPALSLVTGGPGHTNSLTGIATAYQVGSPLISVSGAASTAQAGRQVFQVIDQAAMAVPVNKWTGQPSAPSHIPYFLGRAWNEAISGRMGPVHLTIPVDVFAGSTDAPLPMPQPLGRTVSAPSSRDVERALELLRKAERPVVIGGSGLWWADAGPELNTFLAVSQLPYYDVTLARGMVTHPEAVYMGYADPALNKAVRQAFPEADLVLVLGKRIDYRLAMGGPRLFSPKARFIQVDIQPQELGLTRHLELGVCADCKSFLAAINDALAGRSAGVHPSWLATLHQRRAEWEQELDRMASDTASPIHPAAFFRVLRDHLPDNVMYSWDGGDFIHWGRVTLPARNPGGWMRLGPLATIGSALPNAIAMQLEWPDRPVLLITGDGSLGFYIAELDTLVRYNLPVITIVGNDAGWGVERELQSETCGSTVACELRSTRYDLVMKGFGGDGENVETLEEVVPALGRAFSSRRAYLLNVNIRGARSPFTEWQLSGKKK
jgi:acetolactate synthase-1/2/3 large subunit